MRSISDKSVIFEPITEPLYESDRKKRKNEENDFLYLRNLLPSGNRTVNGCFRIEGKIQVTLFLTEDPSDSNFETLRFRYFNWSTS